MEDPKQRLVKTISDAEVERRWKAVREMMREKKIDYLVIQRPRSSWAVPCGGSPIGPRATSFR